MIINPTSRSYTILIAEAAVSVVHVVCRAWRLYMRSNRSVEDIDQGEKPAQWPPPSVFDGLMRSAPTCRND